MLPATTAARLVSNNVEAATSQLVNLFPNPATDKITVILSQPATQVATMITDLTGAKHSRNTYQQVNATTLEIPVNSLSPAVYLLHLQTEHGRQILKFVKQ